MKPSRYLSLAALILVAYLPAWPGGFLVEDWHVYRRVQAWSLADTVRFELGRPLADRERTLRERPDFFTAALWRPIPNILWHGEALLFGEARGPWLLLRLGLHIATAWLLALAVIAWTRDGTFAWLFAAISALHASRFHVLFVPVASSMLLAALGVVLALWGLGLRRSGKGIGLLGIVCGAALACLSYEQAVAVLPWLLVLDFVMPLEDASRPRTADVLRRASPLLLTIGTYIVLRVVRFEGIGGYASVESGESTLGLSPWAYLSNLVTTSWYTCVSLLLPVSRADWSLWGEAGAAPTLINAAIGAATFAVLARSAAKAPQPATKVAVAYLGFVAWTMLPLAGALGGHDPWNRYLFFPGFFWVGLLAWSVKPNGRSARANLPAALCLLAMTCLAWWACSVWKVAWGQAHGLHTALATQAQEERTAFVYLDGFSEWVGGRNLFIRDLDGPIDTGHDPQQLRVWQASGDFHSAVPIASKDGWPFDASPLVQHGAWDRAARTLKLHTPNGYRAGTAEDVLRWTFSSVVPGEKGHRAWKLSRLLDAYDSHHSTLAFRVRHPLATLDSPELPDTWTPAVLGIAMSVLPGTPSADHVEVLFYTDAQPVPAASHIARFQTVADGAMHSYIFTLLDHPVPALHGPVRRIALRPSRHAGAQVGLEHLWIAAANARTHAQATINGERP